MIRYAIIFLSLLALTAFTHEELPNNKALKIIQKGEQTMQGVTSQASMRMLIHRPLYQRELTLRSWVKKDESALVEILSPAKEEGVSSLRKDNMMWNYLPKTDQILRVPSSMMLQSWMGSDFTNDDLMKASSLSKDYNHKIIKSQTIKGEAMYLIECTPKPQAPVVWGKVLYWARKIDSLPIHQKFFDDKQTLVRNIHFSEFKKMGGRVIPTQLVVTKSDQPEEYTQVNYDKVIFDQVIPDSLFSKDQLRKHSQEGKVITAGWYFGPQKKRRNP